MPTCTAEPSSATFSTFFGIVSNFFALSTVTFSRLKMRCAARMKSGCAPRATRKCATNPCQPILTLPPPPSVMIPAYSSSLGTADPCFPKTGPGDEPISTCDVFSLAERFRVLSKVGRITFSASVSTNVGGVLVTRYSRRHEAWWRSERTRAVPYLQCPNLMINSLSLTWSAAAEWRCGGSHGTTLLSAEQWEVGVTHCIHDCHNLSPIFQIGYATRQSRLVNQPCVDVGGNFPSGSETALRA